MTPLALAILISGRGSNMRALVEASAEDTFPAKPVLVLSNRPDAGGLDYAKANSIPNIAIDHRAFRGDREAFEKTMDVKLRDHGVEMIALAGFMRVLTPWFVTQWQGRMVNIHPSLLPKYPGLDTHARALAAGDREAGCTVHWVSEGVDTGDIIGQAAVPIHAGDSPSELANRVLVAEHQLYPDALATAARQIMRRRGSD